MRRRFDIDIDIDIKFNEKFNIEDDCGRCVEDRITKHDILEKLL